MKNFIKITLIIALVVLPVVSFAQTTGTTINCSGIKDLTGIVTCAKSLMGSAIYLLMSAAVVYTVYGAFNFIRAEGNDRDNWRQVMIHGIIGLFVITSIWGLVSILTGTFGFQNTQISPPAFNSTL